MLELFGLAPHEVAVHLGKAWLGEVRVTSGLLLSCRPGLRVRTDAPCARSEAWRDGLESAGMGPSYWQDPAWQTAAGSQPAAQDGGNRPTRSGRLPVWSRGRARKGLQ